MIETSNISSTSLNVLEWAYPCVSSQQTEDSRLIQEAQHGSLEAFNQLVLIY